MRKIIFRGWDAMGIKGWVYGDLVHNQKVTLKGTEPRVMVGGYEVVPESVGQFTSLYDKNKKEIYEGDILAVAGVNHGTLEVRFVRGVFAFLWNGSLDEEYPTSSPTHEWAEVVGNVFEKRARNYYIGSSVYRKRQLQKKLAAKYGRGKRKFRKRL